VPRPKKHTGSRNEWFWGLGAAQPKQPTSFFQLWCCVAWATPGFQKNTWPKKHVGIPLRHARDAGPRQTNPVLGKIGTRDPLGLSEALTHSGVPHTGFHVFGKDPPRILGSRGPFEAKSFVRLRSQMCILWSWPPLCRCAGGFPQGFSTHHFHACGAAMVCTKKTCQKRPTNLYV
jgi:hypothetical protein